MTDDSGRSDSREAAFDSLPIERVAVHVTGGTNPCDDQCRVLHVRIATEPSAGVTSEAGERLNAAYAERNRLVAALSHLFADASWRGLDPAEPDWTVVYIDLPTGQVSWHIPDAEMEQFPALALRDPTGWDGHDTDEKYRRLAALRRGDICRDVTEAVQRAVNHERSLAATPSTSTETPTRDVGGGLREAIRGYRNNRGLTLRGLADAVGVDFTYLSKIENGHDTPSRELVERIDREVMARGDLVALYDRLPCSHGRLAATTPSVSDEGLDVERLERAFAAAIAEARLNGTQRGLGLSA